MSQQSRATDGQAASFGQHIAVDGGNMLDPEVYTDPKRFDYRRYFRVRQGSVDDSNIALGWRFDKSRPEKQATIYSSQRGDRHRASVIHVTLVDSYLYSVTSN